MEPINKIRNFKDLVIWQEGIRLVKEIYQATRQFPRAEMFGLTQQMRRSAVSVPSNIAEGFNRYHLGEKTQFLHVASGSAAELETHAVIAGELGYLDHATVMLLTKRIETLCRKINSALTSLRAMVNYVSEDDLVTSYELPVTNRGDGNES
jgi:four helix bundle protein